MTTTGVDLFSALPGDVLLHVLSFLPSRDAVQASVLSRRWRHLWRSTPALRVPGPVAGRPYHAFILFVNRFLLLRDGASPLRTFEIDVCHYDEGDDDDFDLWIRHAALTCQMLDVTASVNVEECILRLTSGPLANAHHLTTLRLSSVRLHGDFLDLSCCPVLVHLSLSKCILDCKAIVSRSLRRLSVAVCSSSWTTANMEISTPSLRWLHLAEAPRFLLESMPSLTTATVLLSRDKLEDCSSRSVLLDALSEATSLELMALSSHGQAILQGELKWCPTFIKLKNLVLNEWCNHESELACLLSHTPIIEKLTFEISKKPSYKLKPTKSYVNLTCEKKTFEHLKIVEVKCQEVGRRVFKVLRVLSACGIPLDKISISKEASQNLSVFILLAQVSDSKRVDH